MLLAWVCAILFAAVQAHFFLQGYRLTGDEVLFEHVILHGESAGYIAQTAAQQGRVGLYILLPLLMAGSYFADHLGFRIFYVLLWYVDILLFSAWAARMAKSRITLSLFVAIVALQSMIGYHMPPVGYPFQLGLPVFALLSCRFRFVRDSLIVAGPYSSWWRKRRIALNVIYMLALISSEYMMIIGGVLLAAEIISLRSSSPLLTLREVLTRFRDDLVTLPAVGLVYIVFRQSQPTHYDGTSLDGLGDLSATAQTFAMHVLSGTWLPFFNESMLSRAVVVQAIGVGALCLAALLFNGLSRPAPPEPETSRKGLLAGVFLLGIIAITLPVVSASKQQQWCLVDHNCSWLDSRISLFFLMAALAVAMISLQRTSPFKRVVNWLAVAALTTSAALSFIVSAQQAQGMKTATEAWSRAKIVACSGEALSAARESNFIDPNQYISMHAIMEREVFWNEYVAHLANNASCSKVTVLPPFMKRGPLALNEAEAVDANGSGARFLRAGWSHLEQSGVWSDGHNAVVAVPVAASVVPRRVSLVLQGYQPVGTDPQTVLVSMNGVVAGHWSVISSEAKSYAVDVPRAVGLTGGVISLRLDVEHPVSPLETHQSTDPRRLGVFLSSIRLERQDKS